MKRKGDRYSMQTSLIVAALKRLLPIGLNICAPGDQELIALAKNRFSLVSLLLTPLVVIIHPLDLRVFLFLWLPALCNISCALKFLVKCSLKQLFYTGSRTSIKDCLFCCCFEVIFIFTLVNHLQGIFRNQTEKTPISGNENKWITYELLHKICDGWCIEIYEGRFFSRSLMHHADSA